MPNDFPNRLFVKDPHLIHSNIIEDRRAAQQRALRERRHAKLDLARREHHHYIIHGHGFVPKQFESAKIKIPNAQLHFYCDDGETTTDAAHRDVNAGWPKLFARLTTAPTLPPPCEVVPPDSSFVPLFLSDTALENNGIHVVTRNTVSGQVVTSTKVCGIPKGGNFLSNIVKLFVEPDFAARKGSGPINLHWLACRIHL